MTFTVNDGSRPSLLLLGRRATGEVEGSVPVAYQRALEEARARMPRFDFEVLRTRSYRLDDRAAPAGPERRWSWSSWLVPVLVAAGLLVTLRPPAHETRLRGSTEAALELYVLDGGVAREGRSGEVLRAGDQVQFAYQSGGRDSLVLLDVDGTGRVSVFWPAGGDLPVRAQRQGTRLLEDSIVLDDAPGPEVFVGVFGARSVGEAVTLVRDAWQRGGPEAVERLADARPDLAVVVIHKEGGTR